MIGNQGVVKYRVPGHPPDHEQMVGVAVLAAVEFRHAAEGVWQHFSDCRSMSAMLERVASLDEATFAGVVMFGLLVYVFIRPQLRFLKAKATRQIKKWSNGRK